MGGGTETKCDDPTQKPAALYTRPIANHLARGECCYEPFGGSGTAIIAAEQARTRCQAMEVDPRYVDGIRQRWGEFVHGERSSCEAVL